jgi:recombination protein RecA
MVERTKLSAATKVEPPKRFVPKARDARFVSTGSTILNLILNGGYGIGRIVNIVGDKSAGKTLLAIEACANFALLFGAANNIRYLEAESAFDEEYADMIGMPVGLKVIRGIRTIEDFCKDLMDWLENRVKSKRSGPCLYVIDSLDALSDDAEMKRDLGDATYGTAKAKLLSEFFRTKIEDIEKAQCTVLVISQVRDKIGAMALGEQKQRSGGKALDFYASQIVWLAEVKKIERQVLGVKRVVGTTVLCNAKKMKMGPPFRKGEISIVFNYGVDDEISMANWLIANKAEDKLEYGKAKDFIEDIQEARQAQDRESIAEIHRVLKDAVTKQWMEIEDALKPSISKYGR